jgi:putative ABC transport system permease protein
MDGTVLWFALALTLVTGLLFGIAPAWRTARVDLNTVLQHGGRGSATRMSARVRNGLAAAELALATVLLIGAGLFLQSLANLGRVKLGFSAPGLMTFQLAPPTAKYPLNGRARQFYRTLQDSLPSLPGVRGAAVSSGIPFGAGNYTTHPMLTTDQSVLPPNTAVPIDWRIASPGYFKTMGIPLLRGRDFTDADGPLPAPPVMIIRRVKPGLRSAGARPGNIPFGCRGACERSACRVCDSSPARSARGPDSSATVRVGPYGPNPLLAA